MNGYCRTGERVHKYRGRVGSTERAPWLIGFLSGLIHGPGFDGALAEIGVPQSNVPMALLTFNLGVDTGQLLSIAAVPGCLLLAAVWPSC